METLERYLLVSAIVLFLFVFYRWLLKYLRRNDVQGNFSYVYPFAALEGQTPRQVKFEIPQNCEVRGVLWSIEGKEIRQIFSDTFQKGTHTREIDIRGLEAGVYLLKLYFPNQVVERSIRIY
jgi:hypothetical protein